MDKKKATRQVRQHQARQFADGHTNANTIPDYDKALTFVSLLLGAAFGIMFGIGW